MVTSADFSSQARNVQRLCGNQLAQILHRVAYQRYASKLPPHVRDWQPNGIGTKNSGMAINRRTFSTNVLSFLALRPGWAIAHSFNEVVVRPEEYRGALRNPLKGLRSGDPAAARALPYATLAKSYLKWNALESNAADTVQRIREVCDREWEGLPQINTKVVPRVYLDWPPGGHFWPADLPQGQYGSEQFQQRAIRLIEKLGECWDNDPRVAFVETGLVGLWGEQHDPEPAESLQTALGDAFVRCFRNKLLMNRYPGHFLRYPFGIYWDSFGHKEELATHLPLLTSSRLSSRWKIAPMGGETAFDWGTPLGKDPTDAVVRNADRIIALIRKLHWNHLGWLSNYDQTNARAVNNAAHIQEALGYRFLLEEVRYTPVLRHGATFSVSLSLKNTGSSPFYYPWPVEVSLVDPATRTPQWRARLHGADLRSVLPSQRHTLQGRFVCPSSVSRGRYLLVISILDPAGNMPAVKLATVAYWQGGRHPVGWVGVEQPAAASQLPSFDDPGQDQTLRYLA